MPWGCSSAVKNGSAEIAVPDAEMSPQVTRHGLTNAAGVNVRTKPSKRAWVAVQIKKGTLLEITDETTDAAGDTWFAVKVAGNRGFIRSDLVEEMTEEAYQEAIKPKAAAKPRAGTHSAASENAAASNHQKIPNNKPAWFGRGDAYFHSDDVCPMIANPGQISCGTITSAKSGGYRPCNYCWCVGCMFNSN